MCNTLVVERFLQESNPPRRSGHWTAMSDVMRAARTARLILWLVANYEPASEESAGLLRDVRDEALAVRQMAWYCAVCLAWMALSGDVAPCLLTLVDHYQKMAASVISLFIGDCYEFVGSASDALYAK